MFQLEKPTKYQISICDFVTIFIFSYLKRRNAAAAIMARSISKNNGTTIAATLGFEAFIATTKIIPLIQKHKVYFPSKHFVFISLAHLKPQSFPYKKGYKN